VNASISAARLGDQREVVDVGEQHPFRQRLELGRHHRAAQHDRPPALVDHRGQPQPGGAERGVAVDVVTQAAGPEHVLLDHDDVIAEPLGQLGSDGRLSAAAGAGQREQRQPQERPPVPAPRAHQLVAVDDRRIRPVTAAGADRRIEHRR